MILDEKPSTWATFRDNFYKRIVRFRTSKAGLNLKALRASKLFGWAVIVVTLFAVFGDDIRLAAAPKSADTTFSALFYLCFVFFAFDILLACLLELHYTHTVIFFLDVIATISLVLHPVIENQTGSSNSRGLALARIARIVRLMRVMRVTKFAQASSDKAMQKASQKRREARRGSGNSNHITGVDPNLEEPATPHSLDREITFDNRDSLALTPSIPARTGKMGAFDGFMAPKSKSKGARSPEPSPANVHLGLDKQVKEREKSFGRNDSIDEDHDGIHGIKHQIVQRVRSMSETIMSRRRKPSITSSDTVRKGIAKATLAPSNMPLTMELNEHVGASTSSQTSEQRDDSPSMLGVTLIQKTTEKIILLVLVLAVGVQLIDLEIPDRAHEGGLRLLHNSYNYYNNLDCFNSTMYGYTEFCATSVCCPSWSSLISRFSSDLSYQGVTPHIKYLRVQNVVFLDESVSKLRKIELSDFSTGDSKIIVDVKEVSVTTALWSIGQTVFITLVLLVFPYVFGRDVLQLVITPLEVIFDRVQSLALNPSHDILFGEEIATGKSFELEMIGDALGRLTKLLQVGLGEAGSSIIARNLQLGKFSALLPGSRLDAIFAFCDIRNFTDCCEVLQEECVTFVNTVAAIISRCLSRYKGSINKNIGDAFLLVWKFKQDGSDESFGGSHLLSENAAKAAESALRACLMIIRDIEQSPKVQEFADRPLLKARLGRDFKIRLGFGLHMGWAIEGAVGSEYKIDATYLSPHVNTAMRLEGDTKQYGVPMLMSDSFVSLLSARSRSRCRAVDVMETTPNGALSYFSYQAGQGAAKIVHESQEYYSLYSSGNWEACKPALQKFLETYPNDPPAKALWNVMEPHDFVAPVDWLASHPQPITITGPRNSDMDVPPYSQKDSLYELTNAHTAILTEEAAAAAGNSDLNQNGNLDSGNNDDNNDDNDSNNGDTGVEATSATTDNNNNNNNVPPKMTAQRSHGGTNGAEDDANQSNDADLANSDSHRDDVATTATLAEDRTDMDSRRDNEGSGLLR